MTYRDSDWPASQSRSAIGVKPFAPLGHDFPGGVKAGDVATVLGYVVEQWAKRVEPLGEGCWGYSYRVNKNNARSLSRHSRGIAIDINAPQHPNGKRGTFSAKQVAELRKIASEVEDVVRFGEFYKATIDGMHAEINASPAEVARVAAALRRKNKPTPTPRPAPKPTPTTSKGDRMLVQFEGDDKVFEVVGSHLEWVTGEAFKARGLAFSQVKKLPAAHPLSKLKKVEAS